MNTIPLSFARDLMNGDADGIVRPEQLVGTTRWGCCYSVIFKLGAGLYELVYEIGSGDSDFTSADFWVGSVEVQEVEPHEVTTIEYRRVS